MKPVEYLRARTIHALALALAYQRVMQTQPAPRRKRKKVAGKQLRLGLDRLER